MLKTISRIEAYGVMNEEQHKKYNDVIERLEHKTDNLSGSNIIFRFNDVEGELLIQFYIEKELVEGLTFYVKKQGRPSLGTTKKVSLTLPDEIWEMIEKRKEKWGVSQSQTLRTMIEGYFYPDRVDGE